MTEPNPPETPVEPRGEPGTEAGRRFIERHGTAKQREVIAIEAEAARAALSDVERLRRQNKEAADRHDRETADLRSRVAHWQNAAERARELVRGSPVDWTDAPASKEPDGWWRYTSQQNRDILVAAVSAARAALERVRQRPGYDIASGDLIRQWLDELRTPVRAAPGPGIDVERLAEAMDAVMPGLRGPTVVCEEHRAYWPLGNEAGDQVTAGDFADTVALEYDRLAAPAMAGKPGAAE